MKYRIMLVVCGVFVLLNTYNFVEFVFAYVFVAPLGCFVLFSFERKKQKREEPPSDIKDVIEALRLIEDVAYHAIEHDDIRFRKGSYSRSIEGLGIVSVEIDRRTIIRQILSSKEDVKTARWISGWLAKHRDENWEVYEIDAYTYEALTADW